MSEAEPEERDRSPQTWTVSIDGTFEETAHGMKIAEITDADVGLYVTVEGGLVALPLDEHEPVGATIGVEDLRFERVWPSDAVFPGGSVIRPLGDWVLETVSAGIGSLTFTGERAIGVIWKSPDLNIPLPHLRAHIDPDTVTGVVKVSAAPRDAFLDKSFGKVRRGVISSFNLTGYGMISGTPRALLDPESGDYLERRPKAIRRVIAAFVDGEPLPSIEELLAEDHDGDGAPAAGALANLPPVRQGEERKASAEAEGADEVSPWPRRAFFGTLLLLAGVLVVFFMGRSGDSGPSTAASRDDRPDTGGAFELSQERLTILPQLRREIRETIAASDGFPSGAELAGLAGRVQETRDEMERQWTRVADRRDLGNADSHGTMARLRAADLEYLENLQSELERAPRSLNAGPDHAALAALDRSAGDVCMAEHDLRRASPDLVDTSSIRDPGCAPYLHAELRRALGAETLGVELLDQSTLAPQLRSAHEELGFTGQTTADLMAIHYELGGTDDPGAPLAAYLLAIELCQQGDARAALPVAAEATGQFILPDKATVPGGDINAAPDYLLGVVTADLCLNFDGSPYEHRFSALPD